MYADKIERRISIENKRLEREREAQRLENETYEVVKEKRDRAKERYKRMRRDVEKVREGRREGGCSVWCVSPGLDDVLCVCARHRSSPTSRSPTKPLSEGRSSYVNSRSSSLGPRDVRLMGR